MSPKEWETLTPDTVRPVQFFPTPGAASQPEKRLMLAVLESAVWLLLKNSVRRGRRVVVEIAEAKRWIASDTVDWPFSFVNICRVLGLDVGALRRRLLASASEMPAQAPDAVRAESFPFRRVASGRHQLR